MLREAPTTEILLVTQTKVIVCLRAEVRDRIVAALARAARIEAAGAALAVLLENGLPGRIWTSELDDAVKALAKLLTPGLDVTEEVTDVPG